MSLAQSNSDPFTSISFWIHVFICGVSLRGVKDAPRSSPLPSGWCLTACCVIDALYDRPLRPVPPLLHQWPTTVRPVCRQCASASSAAATTTSGCHCRERAPSSLQRPPNAQSPTSRLQRWDAPSGAWMADYTPMMGVEADAHSHYTCTCTLTLTTLDHQRCMSPVSIVQVQGSISRIAAENASV